MDADAGTGIYGIALVERPRSPPMLCVRDNAYEVCWSKTPVSKGFGAYLRWIWSLRIWILGLEKKTMTEKKKRATRAEVEALEKRVTLLTSELEFAREQIRRNSSLRETIDDERNYTQALLEIAEGDLATSEKVRRRDAARAKLLEKKLREGLRGGDHMHALACDQETKLPALVDTALHMISDLTSRQRDVSLKFSGFRSAILNALGCPPVDVRDDEIVSKITELVNTQSSWRPLSEAPEGQVIVLWERTNKLTRKDRAVLCHLASVRHGKMYYCTAAGEINAGPFDLIGEDQWTHLPEVRG